MDQVDLVDAGAPGKFLAAASGSGHRLVFSAADLLTGISREIRQLLRKGLGELRQVGDRKGGGLARTLLGALGGEVVGDLLADLQGLQGWIRGKAGQPVGVVPADARLGLFAADQVVGVIAQHESGLRGRHQTGVKADEVVFDPGVFEGRVDAGQGHGTAAGIFLIVAVAADRAAAVIPEDQGCPVGREVLGAPFDEGGKGPCLGHGVGAGVVDQAFDIAVLDLPDLVLAAADGAVSPAFAAARVNDQIDILADGGADHLVQVTGRHGGSGFQIGAAHVDQDGVGVSAVALDRRILGPGVRGDPGVEDGVAAGSRAVIVPAVICAGPVLDCFLITGIAGKPVHGQAASAEEHGRDDDQDAQEASLAAGDCPQASASAGVAAAGMTGAAERAAVGTAGASASEKSSGARVGSAQSAAGFADTGASAGMGHFSSCRPAFIHFENPPLLPVRDLFNDFITFDDDGRHFGVQFIPDQDLVAAGPPPVLAALGLGDQVLAFGRGQVGDVASQSDAGV